MLDVNNFIACGHNISGPVGLFGDVEPIAVSYAEALYMPSGEYHATYEKNIITLSCSNEMKFYSMMLISPNTRLVGKYVNNKYELQYVKVPNSAQAGVMFAKIDMAATNSLVSSGALSGCTTCVIFNKTNCQGIFFHVGRSNGGDATYTQNQRNRDLFNCISYCSAYYNWKLRITDQPITTELTDEQLFLYLMDTVQKSDRGLDICIQISRKESTQKNTKCMAYQKIDNSSICLHYYDDNKGQTFASFDRKKMLYSVSLWEGIQNFDDQNKQYSNVMSHTFQF